MSKEVILLALTLAGCIACSKVNNISTGPTGDGSDGSSGAAGAAGGAGDDTATGGIAEGGASSATGGTASGSGGAGGDTATGGIAEGGASSAIGVAGSGFGGASRDSSTGGAPTGGVSAGGAPIGGAPMGGSSGAGGASDLLDGCVLLLHMEESEWNGTMDEVSDTSGFHNHGTARGNVTTIASGRYGRGGIFDGSGWIEVPDHPSLDATTALTVSVWVYTTQIQADYWPGYVTKRLGYEDQTAFAMHQGEEGFVTIDVGEETSRFLSTIVLTASTWTHLALAYDATWPEDERVRLYMDGVLDRFAPEPESTITNSVAPVMIGNLPNGGDVFRGRIDEIGMWTRALSADEVARVAAGELAL